MSQTQDQKPIVIDIEIIKKSPRNSAIEARLKRDKSVHDTAPTLEDIEEKLTKAEEARRDQLTRKAQTHTDERRHKVLLRKMSQDMETRLRLQRELQRLEDAGEKRNQQLLRRVRIAKRETEKLSKAQERRELSSTDKKMMVEQRLNEHLANADQNKKEREQQVVAKAKSANHKVTMTVRVQKLKQENELETLKMSLEKKLKLAEMKRDEMIEKRIETAAQFGARRSPSKEQAPDLQ